MKLRRLGLSLAVLGIASMIPCSVHANTETNYIPKTMRGLWYGYSRSIGWEYLYNTKRSTTWSSGKNRDTLKGRNLRVIHSRNYFSPHHVAVVFQPAGQATATDAYWIGKAKVRGKYRRALIQNGNVAMFHSKVKHYYIPKYYRN
ncbi:hypothetical protein LASUN_10530 [Lentilactobacillus sunkii]|uniref:Uncharacterized protein n=1 Tax=Lentilactobacillus sunkii TaxID=481719 RepID=A0A1E7XEB2_9LACO|nr:hypothetical protein [Lentilactobacillus sunkii]OFA11444.1 hypothetical protein LASUN_10530 [Lentilactobacillus sunkii]